MICAIKNSETVQLNNGELDFKTSEPMVEGERECTQRPDPRLVHCGDLELNPMPPEWFTRPLMTPDLAYTPILPNINPSIHGEPATLTAYVLFLLGTCVPSFLSTWNIFPWTFPIFVFLQSGCSSNVACSRGLPKMATEAKMGPPLPLSPPITLL